MVILACALLGGVYGGRVKATESLDSEVEESLRSLAKVYSAVEENYADPVNADKAIYNGAIPGMLRNLDPHSSFFDPRAYLLWRDEQRGRYYGVGMQVALRGGKTVVLVPFPGSPALKAGLRRGDVIAQVDNKPTDNLTTTEVAELLKGQKGTTVRIVVLREGSSHPLEFLVTRDEIPRSAVEQAFEVQPGIGYIKIANFNETTGRELATALRKLDVRRLKGLILDLRDNPGGLLTEGVAVADMFLAKGQVIVSHRGRASGEKIYWATHGNNGLDYPLVVLINHQSASASEIVAGAIQDHDRGLVVGESSFGKGMVQTVYPLAEKTGLALTTAFFHTPSGRLIQRKFAGLSLYDYYYYRDEGQKDDAENKLPRQTRVTDSGRTVYGGGGITPDQKVSALPNPFLRTLTIQKYAFFNFACYYLGAHGTVPRNFQVTDAVLGDFRRFLERERIPYTENELQQNMEAIKRQIKQELSISVFGKLEGERIGIEADPQVLRAIEVLPKAKELALNARRILAQR
jgi:carboxyl-terminal processing protease